jgi:hypothetical protein
LLHRFKKGLPLCIERTRLARRSNRETESSFSSRLMLWEMLEGGTLYFSAVLEKFWVMAASQK